MIVSPQYDIVLFGDFCPYSPYHNNRLKLAESLLRILDNAIIKAINLECPITESQSFIKKTGPVLKAPLESINLLTTFEFNLCNLANNHIMDFGSQGLRDTIGILEYNNIDWVGVEGFTQNSYRIIEIKDKRIAFVSFTENEFSTISVDSCYASPLDYYAQYKLITELKKTVDFVIVQYHGGIEFYDYPTPKQKKYAHFLVDIGASIVICHHSHCVSGFELYNNVSVFYGVGNFYFPEEGNSDPWFTGFGLGINISGEIEVEIIPIKYNISSHRIDIVEPETDKLNIINQAMITEMDIKKKWLEYCQSKQERTLKVIFQPNLIERGLIKAGFLKNYLKRKVSRGFMNHYRCESHCEVLKSTIEQIIGVDQ